MAVDVQVPARVTEPTRRPTRRRAGSSRGAMATAGKIAVVVIICVIMLFPLWVMVITAVSPEPAFTQQLRLWPSALSLANFSKVIAAWPVATWFQNSITVTAITTVLTTVVSLTGGYAFARLRFPGKNVLFVILLATLLVPAQAIFVPQFRLVDSLGLIGTFWAVILPGAAATFGLFLSRQFMLAIPAELIDAARVDGAGPARIFVSVVLPLCRPLAAVLVLLSVLYQWNDFLWPLIALREPSLYTVPIGLQFLQGQYQTDYGALMAMALLATAPLVILFIAFQRFFVQGLATTGLR